MRLSRLELLAYGPFRGVTLDFEAPGLHIVFGRNEAGKSTTLRAIVGLLYGIDRTTPDAHVHKAGDLRIGGVIDGSDGRRVHFVRRKGNTNTLLDMAGRPFDEAQLEKLLGGVSQETFRHAFGLDHVTLEAGAKALLDGKGDLGESLFDASVGGGEVRRILAELTNEADRIYKPRASSLPLNEALKSFADAQKMVRERQSLPEAFVAQEKALEDATNERNVLVSSRSALVSRRSRIDRARRRIPLEGQRQRARDEAALFGPLAEQTARVFALKDRFVAYEKAVEQRRTHRAEAARLGDRFEEAARRAGLDPSAPAAMLRLDAKTEARVQSLLRERSTLTERLEASRIDIVRIEREVARLAEVDRPVSDGRDALAMVLDRARAFGDIELRQRTERARWGRRRTDLEAKAALLGAAPSDLDAFVTLRLPAVVTVSRLEARASEIEKTIARIDESAFSLEGDAASIAKQLASQTGDFAPPDAAALRLARDARDEAWRALGETSSIAARRSAEAVVERLVREADTIADRMIHEADRVTTLARLRSEAEVVSKQIDKLAREKERARSRREELEGELSALFAEAKIRPLGFSEMRHWLEHHAQIVDAYGSLREAEADLNEEAAKAEAVAKDLAEALVAAGDDGTNVSGTQRWTELVAMASRRLSMMEVAWRNAEEASKSLVELRAKLEERIAIRTRDEDAFALVLEKLEALVVPLGVHVNASGDEVNRALEALRELFILGDRRSDVEARARAADDDVRSFEADLSRAVADLATDLATMDLRDAAPLLFARARAADENAKQLVALGAQLDGDVEVVLDADERELLEDPERAARAERELVERIDELDRETTRLAERIGALRAGLERMRVDSHASEAAELAQQALARVREGAERWSRVKLAAALLSREIERYREEHQAPVLASSSLLFSRLTLGAFAGIKAGFDEKDRPCLRCVRADGATEVDVAGLSDGTRDQLYLSLRLASLLRRAEVRETMPLVLDDVLIQIDDQRASAALGVLAEVSHRMQVLFFTHHARLVELARARVPPSDLVVHELVSSTSAGEWVESTSN